LFAIEKLKEKRLLIFGLTRFGFLAFIKDLGLGLGF